MELLVENEAQKVPSEYEIEMGKPEPRLIHGAIQFNIGFEIKTKYPNKFRIANEVILETQPSGSTPDVVIYETAELDFNNDPARRQDAPLLTIEIQSPSQSTKDMTSKLEPYFSFGIKSCWIIVPEFKAIFVYNSPYHYDFFYETDILNDKIMGIEIPVAKVFV